MKQYRRAIVGSHPTHGRHTFGEHGNLAVADELITSDFVNHAVPRVPPEPTPFKQVVQIYHEAFHDGQVNPRENFYKHLENWHPRLAGLQDGPSLLYAIYSCARRPPSTYRGLPVIKLVSEEASHATAFATS